MGKSKTTGKHRLDKFYHLAKEQGYRSRAAFKLVQLDSKYRFLSSARAVLDLCAAPGGWLQVAYKHMPVGSLIVGVDLVPIRAIRGALTLQEDITSRKCKTSVRKLLRERGYTMFDVVLHDGSPNVGGAWAKESTSQAALVLDSLKLTTEFLTPNGTFVTKVFRSQDYNSLLYAFKQLFEKVEVTKPVASRSTSAEIYVICLRYRAPAKIDPRLLDVKHLFQEIPEPPKVVDVLRGSKQKRHREGYEVGNTTFRKECLASDFIWADNPLELLGSITSISFNDPACTSIKDHELTTAEVTVLCDDLRVLGKQEFKQLLKWRLHVRKVLSDIRTDSAVKVKTADDLVKSDEDEHTLNEMRELKAIMETKNKREKKKLAKRHAKAKARATTGMQLDVMEDGVVEGGLFSLASIKHQKGLEAVESGGSSDEMDSENEVLNGSHSIKTMETGESDVDSESERQRYDLELEKYLDQAYNRFRNLRDGSTKRRKRAKLLNMDREVCQDTKTAELVEDMSSDETSKAELTANPRLVPLSEDEMPSKEQLKKQWFSQDVFTGLKYDDDHHVEDDDCGFCNHQLHDDTRDNETMVEGIGKKVVTSIESGPSVKQLPKSISMPIEIDFEVVPAQSSGSDTSSDDDDNGYDTDEKAEILAYAKKIIKKKSREEIIDSGYNRYTFDDEGLPDWFLDDEKKHYHPNKPITKEDIEAFKAQFRAINTRPVKKVAEAKARKKRQAMKKLESVKQKVSTIADQPDLSAQSKKKLMDRLYKKAAASNKPKKELVVAKKGSNATARKGRIVVDRRMKKDKRSHGMGKSGRKGKHAASKRSRGGLSRSGVGQAKKQRVQRKP